MITTPTFATLMLPWHSLIVTSIASALTGILMLQAAQAQESNTVTVDVARCLALESEAEQRECFASQVHEVLDAEQNPPTDTAEVRSTGDHAAAPRNVGSSPNAANGDDRRDPDAAETRTAEPEGEFFGTIVSVRERLPNAHTITLDNGQVWEQTEPKRFNLRPGLDVRVYETRWGSRYRLSVINSGGHIQVRRLR